MQSNRFQQNPLPDTQGFDDYDEEDFHLNSAFMRNHQNIEGSTAPSYRR